MPHTAALRIMLGYIAQKRNNLFERDVLPKWQRPQEKKARMEVRLAEGA
jgi:hypothetical protein